MFFVKLKKEEIDYSSMDDYNDMDENLNSYSSTPQNQEYDVFALRNNPQPLIEEFYLYLTNQVKNTNPKTRDSKPFIQIGKPLLNKQGVRDLVNYMGKYVNGHTVQTNLSLARLTVMMRHIADDLSMFMVNSIDDWEIEERYTRSIQNELIGQIDLFLSRGLDDKEREHYSQEQRHEYSHDMRRGDKKKSLGIPSFAKNLFKE